MRRVAVVVGRVLGIALALIAVLIGATMVVLETRWGGERLRRVVVSQANQQLAGRLDIGRLSFGGDRVVVWNVSLRDPEGGQVAQVARAEVEVSIARLLRRELRVNAVLIDSPRLTLVSDRAGLNLSRATAPRRPAPPKKARQPSSGKGWALRLDRFELTDGDVSFIREIAAARSAAAKTPSGGAAASVPSTQHFQLSELRSSLRAGYRTDDGAFDLSFRLSGVSRFAPAGALEVSADGRGHGAGSVDGAYASLSFGDHLAVTLAAQARDQVEIRIAQIALRPEVGRALVPGYPLTDVARLQGDVSLHGRKVSWVLDGGAGGGTLKARGAIDPRRLDAAEGQLALAIPTTRLAGHDWGPVSIDASAHQGVVEKLDLRVAVPGVLLSGHGGGGRERIHFDARLALEDLALTARAVRALTGRPVPALAGHGHIDLGIAGSPVGAPASLGAQLGGQLVELRSGADTIAGLSLKGEVSHLSSRPGQADLEVLIGAVRAGTTRLSGLGLTGRLRGDDVWLAAHLTSPQQVSLAAGGRLDGDRRGLALQRLTVEYPGARWSAEGPAARLRFDEETTSLSTLRLASAGQRLSLEGAKTPDRVTAHVELAGFRLDRLPAALVDPKLGLGGVLAADLRLSGATDNPSLAARVRLDDGRARGFSRMRARVDAALADHRLTGTAGLTGPTLAVDAGFDVPAQAPEPGQPLRLKVDLARLAVADTLRAAGKPAQGDGTVEMHLRAAGSADDPRVDLDLIGRDLHAQMPPTTSRPDGGAVDVGRARLRLRYADRQAHANVDFASSRGGTLRIAARTRVDLSYWRVRRGVDVDQLPIHGRMVARSFDVGWVSRLSPRLETLAGQVSADAALAGTLRDPQFVGDIRWKKGHVIANVPPPPPAK
jgi:translocation and assembly module TamB